MYIINDNFFYFNIKSFMKKKDNYNNKNETFDLLEVGGAQFSIRIGGKLIMQIQIFEIQMHYYFLEKISSMKHT